MCGIAAVLGSGVVLESLVQRIAHRGPDSHKCIGTNSVGLGAARLRIHGGAEADMPLQSRCGSIALVANGEIFNHEMLFGTTQQDSDLQGLADLWAVEGERALTRVRGPFALALWDRRDDSLLIARDEFGVRPLYWRVEDGVVSVASEAVALFGDNPPARDSAAWAHLLAFQFQPAGATLWQGINEVAPGTWLRFRHTPSGLTQRSGSFQCEGSEDLRSALLQSGALQRPRSADAALLLSGGVDSSLVLGLLRAAGALPRLAVVGHFGPQHPHCDERAAARAVARECAVPLLEVCITPQQHLAALRPLLRALGGPNAGPGGPSQWVLAQTLAREGCRIVFSGTGGDEIFGGYERTRLAQQRAAGVHLRPAAGYQSLAAATGPLAQALLFRGRSLLPLLETEVAAAVMQASAVLPLDGPNLATELEAFELRALLPGLLAVDDRCFAAFGMEGRVPLLDPLLAHAALRVPLQERSPEHAPRALLRAAAADLLPESAARRRDKMGFPVPLAEWCAGPWRDALLDPSVGRELEAIGFRPEVRAALNGGRLAPREQWFLLACAFTREACLP